MIKKKILIIGCGWVGNLAADQFLKQEDLVWASTTQEDKLPLLEEKGIHPLLLDFTQGIPADDSVKSLEKQIFDLIIISVPVRRNEDPIHCREKFKNVIVLVNRLASKKVIYLSSIGVYEPKNGTIIETSAVKEQGTIFLIEEYLTHELNGLIILRLGGLFGFGRIPGRYFSGKVTTVGHEKANYVHGTDVARALLELSRKDVPAGPYNLVAPVHPLKKDIYEKMAEKYGFLPVLYAETASVQKEVSSQKLMDALHFTFALPSPLDF